jgi:hypothetical protein
MTADAQGHERDEDVAHEVLCLYVADEITEAEGDVQQQERESLIHGFKVVNKILVEGLNVQDVAG